MNINQNNQYGTDAQRQKDAGRQSGDKNQSLKSDAGKHKTDHEARDDKNMRKSGQH